MRRTLSVAFLTIVAMVAVASDVAAQTRLVQEAKDPGTGVVVRVWRTSAGPRVDVVTDQVELRKEVVNGRVVTSLKGGGESLTITLGDGTLSVATRRRTVTATRSDQRALDEARALVAGSPLTAKAAAAIAHLPFSPLSPVQPLLLTTRAFLLAAGGDDAGSRGVSDWMRQARARVQVVKVGLQKERTPEECWNEYTKAAVAAWDDYLDCVANIRWYDIFGEKGCALVYEIRAIAAFAWYLDCSKLSRIF